MTYSIAESDLLKKYKEDPKFKDKYFILPTDNDAENAFLKHLLYCHQNNLKKKYSDVVTFVDQKDITSKSKLLVSKLNFLKDKIIINNI